jgi:hypothetical protein
MANSETKLRIIIDAENRANSAFSSVQSSLESMEPAFRRMALGGTVAFGAISGFLAAATNEAKNAEAAQFRLAHILRTATGASDEQIEALNRQAEALEKVGVISGEAVTQAQAQLATFDLSADTIAKLTPAILDYAVAEKGAAASTEDLKQMTNGLAQALNGNFASLTRVGFVLDDATKELISNGTEAERTAALVKVLNSTYEGMNVAVRQTTEGGMVALRNEMGRLMETIGNEFLPVLNKVVETITPIIMRITEWVNKNPELTANLIVIALAVTALIAAVGMLGLALIPVIAGFKAMAVALLFLMSPIGVVVIALGVIGFTAYKVASQWEDAMGIMQIVTGSVANAIKSIFEGVINFIVGAINGLINQVNKVVSKLSGLPGIGKKFDKFKISNIEEVKFDRFDTGAAYNNLISRPAASSGGISLNITGNQFLSEDAAEQMGDMILKRLQLSSAI